MNDLNVQPFAMVPNSSLSRVVHVDKADGSKWVADIPPNALRSGLSTVSWDGGTLTARYRDGRKEDISALLRPDTVAARPAGTPIEEALMQAARSLWFAATLVAEGGAAGEALSFGLQADAWIAECTARRLPLDLGPDRSVIRPRYAAKLPPFDGITPGEGSQVLKREREASANDV